MVVPTNFLPLGSARGRVITEVVSSNKVISNKVISNKVISNKRCPLDHVALINQSWLAQIVQRQRLLMWTKRANNLTTEILSYSQPKNTERQILMVTDHDRGVHIGRRRAGRRPSCARDRRG